MRKDLIKIIETYGVLPQLKHFNSEVFEVNEAIIKGEDMKYVGVHTGIPEHCRQHIAEEIADCYVMLEQFRHYYDIGDKEILGVMNRKIKRQLERIDRGE